MAKQTTMEEQAKGLVKWAESLAVKHEGNTTGILFTVYQVRKAGFTIDQAKQEIESVYAN